MRNQIIATVAVATVASLFGTSSSAATVDFAGGTSSAGTNASGGPLYTYPHEGALTLYKIDNTATNLSSAITAGDALAFTGSGLGAGATYNLQIDSLMPAIGSLEFTGGDQTYVFQRANTGAGSSNSLGFAGGSATGFDTDTYSSGSPFRSNNTTNLIVGSGFTGKVVLRASTGTGSPAAFSTGTTTISGGTVEINDPAALPSNSTGSSNVPGPITLSNATLAININTGNIDFAEGNRNAASGQFAGTLTVNGNATLANTSTYFDGTPRQQDIWGATNGGSLVLNNAAVLTVQTGGGSQLRSAISSTGTGISKIAIGNSSSGYLRLSNGALSGSNAVAFDLGNGGTLEVAGSSTTNLGALVGGSNATLRGSNASSGTTAYSIGQLGSDPSYAQQTFNGQILNGFASSNGNNTPTTALVKQLSLTKVGAGVLTLNGVTRAGGAITVSGGELEAGNVRALSDSASAVAVQLGATLDLNGKTQNAGKAIVLSGGSLVNNNAASVSLHSGASGNINDATVVGGLANGAIFGAGTSPTVSVTGGGGSGATAEAHMQLGWFRMRTAGGANPAIGSPGSGYTKAPIITFDAPTTPGGRTIKVVTTINTSGVVTGYSIIDPGSGYTSVPNFTVTNASGDTTGSGFEPVVAMAVNDLVITNAGTGYTSAPTITISGIGTVPANAGANTLAMTDAQRTPTAVGGFGSVNVTATSNIGGSGDLNIGVAITGAGGLNKIGAGTVTMSGTNTYAGATDVQNGKVLVNGANNGLGAVAVQSGATLGGTGSIAGAVTVNTGGILSPGASIESLDVASATIVGTLLAEYDATGSGSADLLAVAGLLTLDPTSVLNLDALGGPADDNAYVIASYGTLSGTFGSVLDLPSGYSINYAYNGNSIAVVIPEPATLGLLGLGSLLGLRRRRR